MANKILQKSPKLHKHNMKNLCGSGTLISNSLHNRSNRLSKSVAFKIDTALLFLLHNYITHLIHRYFVLAEASENSQNRENCILLIYTKCYDFQIFLY